MRPRRVDRLAVVRPVHAGRRNRDGDLRRRELLDVRQVEVVPVDRDRRLPRGDRLRRRLHRDEVPDVLQPLEVVDPRADVRQRAAVRERGRVDAGEGGARRQRAAVQRHLVLVLRLQQVVPRLRHVRDDGAVDAERDHAPVVADPEAAAVLHRARHAPEVVVEVLRVQALVGAGDRERRADVEDVRGARVALERADGLVLLRRRAVGVVVRQLQAELLLERRDDLAVVRPVGRQRDRVDRLLSLRLLHELGERDLLAPHRRRRSARVACQRGRGCEDREPCGCGERAPQHRASAHAFLGDQTADHRIHPVEVVLLECPLQDLVDVPVLAHTASPVEM